MTTETVTPTPRNISNSEVTAFLSCKRMYNYAFVLNLAPKVTPAPLARGTIGHLAFQYYVEARLNGASHEQAMKASERAFVEAMKSGTDTGVVLNAQFLFNRYMGFHNGWPEWKLLGTEQRHFIPISPTLNFPIRYDLYLEEIGSGKRKILDFKFTYDFWTPYDHDINAQMPKYIAVMQSNGLRVDGGILEEIRTRELGKEKSADPRNLWRRTRYEPSRSRTRSVLRQQVVTALQIERHRALPPAEREGESIPIYNKHGACKFCNFKDLCNSQTEGATEADLAVAIREHYVNNDYSTQQQVMEDLL